MGINNVTNSLSYIDAAGRQLINSLFGHYFSPHGKGLETAQPDEEYILLQSNLDFQYRELDADERPSLEKIQKSFRGFIDQFAKKNLSNKSITTNPVTYFMAGFFYLALQLAHNILCLVTFPIILSQLIFYGKEVQQHEAWIPDFTDEIWDDAASIKSNSSVMANLYNLYI